MTKKILCVKFNELFSPFERERENSNRVIRNLKGILEPLNYREISVQKT